MKPIYIFPCFKKLKHTKKTVASIGVDFLYYVFLNALNAYAPVGFYIPIFLFQLAFQLFQSARSDWYLQ